MSLSPAMPRAERWTRTTAATLTFAAFLCLGLSSLDHVPQDALGAETAGRLLLANRTAGRQALVDSAWWPPLPVLVRLPALILFPHAPPGAVSVGASALFGVLGLLTVGATLRARGMSGPARWPMVAGLLLLPGVAGALRDGSDRALALWLFLLATGGLAEWGRSRGLRHLVAAAFALGLLGLTAPEAWPWLAAVLAGSALQLLLSRRLRGRRPAAFLLLALPLLYTTALWFLLNWLIMADALYFLRSLPHLLATATAPWRPSFDGIRVIDAATVAAGGALWLAGAVLRRPGLLAGGGCSALLGLGAHLLGDTPLPFDAAVLRTAALPCLALALVLAAAHARGPALRTLAAVGVLFAGGARAGLDPDFAAEWRPPPVARVAPAALRAEIEAETFTHSPYAKVFAAGHTALPLLGAEPGRVFAHALDFAFERAENDYRGHAIFLLVHAPVGRAAADSIHWRYPGLRTHQAPHTLFARDWGPWRLYEIVDVRPPGGE